MGVAPATVAELAAALAVNTVGVGTAISTSTNSFLIMKTYFGLQWHLTDDCDQRCKHCYIWQKEKHKKATVNLKQAKQVLGKFFTFCEEMDSLPHFSITGGDPLLHPFIWEILEMVKHTDISLMGNPYHLNEAKAKRLKGLNCHSYQMSLDGLEKTHDGLRKPGSFKATLEKIPVLNDARIESTIMATVSLLNYRELPALARLCVQHKAGNFAFARYCPTDGNTQYNIPPSVYRQFLADMWSVYTELIDRGTNFALKDHLWTAFLYEEGLYKLCQDQGLMVAGCHCAVNNVSLLPNGDVYACRRCESKIGNIYEQDFGEIFFSDKQEQYRQIERLEGCKDCKLLNYCRGCHAVSAGTTGNFFAKDPQCWRC